METAFSSKRHWSFIRDCLIDLQRDLINLRSNLHVEIDEALNFFDEINKNLKYALFYLMKKQEITGFCPEYTITKLV